VSTAGADGGGGVPGDGDPVEVGTIADLARFASR